MDVHTHMCMFGCVPVCTCIYVYIHTYTRGLAAMLTLTLTTPLRPLPLVPANTQSICWACSLAQIARHTFALIQNDRCDPWTDPGIHSEKSLTY